MSLFAPNLDPATNPSCSLARSRAVVRLVSSATASGRDPPRRCGSGTTRLARSSRTPRKCCSASTDFITPKNEASYFFRNATLELAKDCDFARRLVNSGRLSLPSTYSDSPLNTPDADSFSGLEVPGAPAVDAPLRRAGTDTWLLPQMGNVFAGIYFNDGSELSPELTKALRSLSDDRLHVSVSVPKTLPPYAT